MRLALELYRCPRTTGHSEDVRLGLDRQGADGLTLGCPSLTLASSNYPNDYPEVAKEDEKRICRDAISPELGTWTHGPIPRTVTMRERIEPWMDSGKNVDKKMVAGRALMLVLVGGRWVFMHIIHNLYIF